MDKNTRENIQVASAIGMLIGGFALAVIGFFTPPVGQIHESVLGIFAECLIYLRCGDIHSDEVCGAEGVRGGKDENAPYQIITTKY